MKTQHTPGPWIATVIGTGYSVRTTKDRGIAKVYDQAENDETGKSNAHLIAAAPDLLAALENTVSAWSAQFEKNGHLAPAWCKQARAAIARAKGETA
jgi:hypothetical protein